MSRNATLRFAAALLVWVAASGPLSAQQTDAQGVVSGTVVGRFQGDPMPLAFATLEALAPGFRRSVVADSLGQYRMEGLPAGPVRLQVTHPGHEALELEVLVPGGGSIRVDLELRGRPVELPPVAVTRNPRIPDPEAREVDPAAVSRVETIALEAGVGVGMPGLVEAVQSMPGNDPANPTDVLFMRGSTTDLKLVLLNGVPVFTPFHVAGLLTSFEPSLIDRATLHVGGAPARYDGGLTYILDLGTRRPARDRLRMSGALDLLSASMGIDAPLGNKGAVLLSGRTLHNVGDEPLGGTSPYGYSDLMGALEFEPAPGHLFSASGFWNRESVLLDFEAPLPIEAKDGASWSNRAAGLTYFGDLGGLTAEVTVAASTYDATLPLLPGVTEEEPDPASLLATAATDRVRVVAELARPSPQGISRLGVSFERQEAAYDARSLAEGSVPSQTLANARSGGAFFDATRTLNPDVTVRFGLRADAFSGARGGLRFAPRGSLTWTIGPQAYLTVAAGRYHQHARTTDTEVERAITDVVADGPEATELLPVATADHVVLSLDQSFGDATRLGLDGFWKEYSGLGGTTQGPIRSSGIDLRLRTVGERTTVWLGYGLSWFWSGQTLNSTSDFSGRHLLSAGLSGSLMGRLQGTARVAYGAGLPFTSIPFGVSAEDGLTAEPGHDDEVREQAPPLVGGLDEAFLRIDLEVHAVLRPRWGDHKWEIRPYLRILNALDRRDALFYTFQPWRDEAVRPLAERPLLPIIGIAWKF